jgi:hypothetical protein
VKRNINLLFVALALILTANSCDRHKAQKPATPESSVFVFVRIPESLMPLERGSKYEDPLDAALKAANLGEVTGGGSQLAAAGADGTRAIEWVGIDVEVVDVERGIPFIKSELARLGAPSTTVLEFNRAGAKVEERIK